MPTAIKVSDTLAEEARAAAADADRSLTGQLEHWARIGKSMESRFTSIHVAAIKKCNGDFSAIENENHRQEILTILDDLRNSPPFQKTTSFLSQTQQPLFEANPKNPDGVVQVNPDGTRVTGKFVNRIFTPTKH